MLTKEHYEVRFNTYASIEEATVKFATVKEAQEFALVIRSAAHLTAHATVYHVGQSFIPAPRS